MVIAREQQSAAARGEAADRVGVGRGQPRADVDREQPQLVEMGVRQAGQIYVVAVRVGDSIARGDGKTLRSEPLRQQRKAAAVPVVRVARDRRLQEDLLHVVSRGAAKGASASASRNSS